ncbi:pyridoxamine 5'-phosphate oxidase family protein [Herbaspirillum sp. NPDC087042]|uniref:pyridoxamine 5'-phosphate oxidase family protein n=1 Tax=Herbaspirillum sp. NPDC087042 TaxID=3364004 RepID=UPI0037F570C5
MDLSEVLSTTWSALHLGASPVRSPFTIWQFATLGLDGAPQVRSIVLRGLDEEARTLSFHTDCRSPKIAEIAADDRVSLAAVDLDSYRQLRVTGRARVVGDAGRRQAMWSAARPHTLILYQAPLVPGTPVVAPEEAQAPADAGAGGFLNFALIDVELQSLELLDLTPGQHRRALFRWEDGQWRGQWIAP